MRNESTTTAERVSKMMRELGDLDQPAFGRLAGASKSMVNQWLSGMVKSVTARYAFELERKTGYRAEWIQTGEGPEKGRPTNELNEPPRPAYFPKADLIDKYDRATQAQKRVVDLVLSDPSTWGESESEIVIAAVKTALFAAEQDAKNAFHQRCVGLRPRLRLVYSNTIR